MVVMCFDFINVYFCFLGKGECGCWYIVCEWMMSLLDCRSDVLWV